MPVRIYHNPRCNTSRKTLALLREKGVEPEIVEYLKTPYTAAQLKSLLAQLKMPAKALLRKPPGTVYPFALSSMSSPVTWEREIEPCASRKTMPAVASTLFASTVTPEM